jgi:2-dehydropantoate 2-reductase
MRIAVFGAGGVGGYLGGRLARAGHAVVFVARGPHLDAIRRDGLRVESPAGDFVVRPAEATDDPEAAGRVDAVLVCVKAWQVRETSRSMLPMLGSNSVVVPFQNGVEAAGQLAEATGSDRVLPGLCRILSQVAAPGTIRHAGVSPSVEFGEPDHRRTARAGRLLAAFRDAAGVTASIPEDIEAAVWEKFLFIAPFAGVGALSGGPAGVVRDHPETRDLLRRAMEEVLDLARARRVHLGPGAVERALALVDSLPVHATSSMQRDLMAGRPSELEYLTGAVVRLARESGVASPTNDRIYRALLPLEERARNGAPR